MRGKENRLLVFAIAMLLSIAVSAVRADDADKCWAFFAFQNSMVGVPPGDQPALLKELGYDGMEYNAPLRDIPEMLTALDAEGLKMFSVYSGANVDAGQPPYDPDLKAAIAQLNGRHILISLFVTGGVPSSADSDDRAVDVIREIADMAEASGLRVAIYPHVGMYVARVEDAVRIAKKVDRKNVGVGFNLCHFLKLDDETNLERRLTEAQPHLFTVSINGADGGDTNQFGWDRLIQTLDRGSFDVAHLLKTLKRLGFTGPVGLQSYAIPGAPRENLRRSIKAWEDLCSRAGD